MNLRHINGKRKFRIFPYYPKNSKLRVMAFFEWYSNDWHFHSFANLIWRFHERNRRKCLQNLAASKTL